jgi:ribonuclease HI
MSKNAFSAIMKTKQSVEETSTGYFIIKGKEVEAHLLQFDGASEPNPGESCGGAVLFTPDRKVVFERGEYIEYATNNQAEYTGLLIGLVSCVEQGIKNLLIEGDSMLVINQVTNKWKVKDSELKLFHTEIIKLMDHFDFVAIRHVYREYNAHADRLTNEGVAKKADFMRLH